jgi:ATP-dependent Lon protease
VHPYTAMTGEITLSGNVLPVGGIKEKVLAAKRAGVHDVILPAENRQQIEEDLLPEQLDGIKPHFVNSIDEVLSIAFPQNEREEQQDEVEREQVLSAS